MAPFKGDFPGSQRITSFFTKFTTPRPPGTGLTQIEHEPVVAPLSHASSADGSDRSKRQIVRKGGRPPKSHAASSYPSSSASNDSGTTSPPRRRGRPPHNSKPSHAAGGSSNTSDVRFAAPQKHSASDSASEDASPIDTTAALAAPVVDAGQALKPAPSAPTASCSSISTLSSVPLSSHPTNASGRISTASSSKRIIKDGLQAVAGSESECDSSDCDLLDPAAFLRPKAAQPAVEPSGLAKTDATNPFTASRKSTEQGVKRKLTQAFTSSLPPRKFPRKSLAQMAAEAQARDLSDAKVASIEHAVGEAKKQEEASQQLEQLGVDLDVDYVMGNGDSGDEDNLQGDRGRLAMQRTEAMQRKNGFYFFLDDRPLFENTPFPVDALPKQPWSKLYANEQSRKQACLSGFAAEMAEVNPLPVTITNWLAHQLDYEQDDSLCNAYVQILEACSQHDESFSHTIASISSIYRTRSCFEHNWTEQLRRGLPPGLKNMLRVVSFCAPAADSVESDAYPSMTAAAFVDLAMINIDELVQKDVNLSLSVESCIERMLDTLPEASFENLVAQVIGILFLPGDVSPINRCRVIASLPSNTPRAYRLRRRLALECFSTTISRKNSKEPNWPMSIHKSLRTRTELSITPDTDYDLLEVHIDMLEIAVAAGFTSYPELMASRTATGGFLATTRLVPTAAGRLHDEHIDGLIQRLNYVTSRIRGGGTTHMRMTEVKTRIDKFLTRLANSVRTTPPVKRGIFDGDEMEQSTLAFTKEVSIRSPKPVKPEAVEKKKDPRKKPLEKHEPPTAAGPTKASSVPDHATTVPDTGSLQSTPKFLPLPGEQLSFTEDDDTRLPPNPIERPSWLSTPNPKKKEPIPVPIDGENDVGDGAMSRDSDDDQEFVTCVEI